MSELDERNLVLAKDSRRKYGAKVSFRILHSEYLGNVEQVTLLLTDGKLGTLLLRGPKPGQLGLGYEFLVEGFGTAATAESAGLKAGQAMLLLAASLNVGMRLEYLGHEPADVFDRTASGGDLGSGYMVAGWNSKDAFEELHRLLSLDLADPSVRLSMELFSAAKLEPFGKARLAMTVSAFEPLAQQLDLPDPIQDFVDQTINLFDETEVPPQLRESMRGRLEHLRKEAVGQALRRLCEDWFPGDSQARDEIFDLYDLRSQIVHSGRLTDPDVLISEKCQLAERYLRKIYSKIFGVPFKFPTA